MDNEELERLKSLLEEAEAEERDAASRVDFYRIEIGNLEDAEKLEK